MKVFALLLLLCANVFCHEEGPTGYGFEDGPTHHEGFPIGRLDEENEENNEFDTEDSLDTPNVIPTDRTRVVPSSNCDELYLQGYEDDGVYFIEINGVRMKVYCQFNDRLNGHHWLIFQRRISGAINFYQNWQNYTQGFGDMRGEFWLGLEKIHRITSSAHYRLRIELTDFRNQKAFAEYSTFAVADAASNYIAIIRGYSGTAGDSFSDQNRSPFSTYDRDNDAWSGNCAVERHGAWWYKKCSFSNLNGKYVNSGRSDFGGILWFLWHYNIRSMKRVEMKLRLKYIE